MAISVQVEESMLWTIAMGIVLVTAIVYLASLGYKTTYVCLNQLPKSKFDTYVINLDRATDRLDHFLKEYSRSDLSTHKQFIRWRATDGLQLERDGQLDAHVTAKARHEMRMQLPPSQGGRGYRLFHYECSVGSVACTLSHLSLLASLPNTDAEYAIIFEDDANMAYPKIIRYLNCRPFPEDFDMILLSHVCVECKKTPKSKYYMKVNRFFSTAGYIVKVSSVPKILSLPGLYPISRQIDSELSVAAMKGDLNIYATRVPLVKQGNFETSIQLPIKPVAGVNIWKLD